MINNRTPLKQSITEKVVAPIDRARLQPDSGVAKLSLHYYRGSVGSGNNTAELDFFSDMWNRFTTEISSLFSIKGLKSDEIYLDVVVRTPNGNQIIPNVRLSKNALHDRNDDDLRRLKNGEEMHVKITYDGGKVSEVTPTSWVFDSPTPEKIQAEGVMNTATGASAPADGSVGSKAATTNPSLSSLEPAGSSFKQLITNDGTISQWAGKINYAARLFGVDANLVAAVLVTESTGYQKAKSSEGAQGLMQLIPGTMQYARTLVSAKYPTQVMSLDPTDPLTNILCGTAYLASLLTSFGGDHEKAIAAYNAGPGTVDRFDKTGHGLPYGINILGDGRDYTQTGGTGPSDPRGYVFKVRTAWSAYYARSTQLGDKKSNQRLEIAYMDQTAATMNSAHMVVGAGAA